MPFDEFYGGDPIWGDKPEKEPPLDGSMYIFGWFISAAIFDAILLALIIWWW